MRLRRHLGPDGAVVLDALSSADGLTWGEAAELSGNRPELGQTVRRKIKRSFNEDTRRGVPTIWNPR